MPNSFQRTAGMFLNNQCKVQIQLDRFLKPVVQPWPCLAEQCTQNAGREVETKLYQTQLRAGKVILFCYQMSPTAVKIQNTQILLQKVHKDILA